MRSRKTPARVGRFDVLEGRIVMSRASIVNADVAAFYNYYAETVPAQVASFQALNTTAMMTQAPTDIAAAAAARQLIVNTITGDANSLATLLSNNLGKSASNSIRLSVTGISGATPGVTFTGGTPNDGSLLASLLTIAQENTDALAGGSGLQLAASVSTTTAFAVSIGKPLLPLAPFGNFTTTYFSDVLPLATQLQTDSQSASTPPTTEQQAAIDADVAAIDAVTITDTNALATGLVALGGKSSIQGIGTIITGVNSTTSPIFTPSAGTAPAFGSLLASLLTLDQQPDALLNPDVTIVLVTQTAFL